jgi:hypothetical protein
VKNRRGETDGTAFEFSTAGAITDTKGQWMIRARGDSLWIASFARGKTEEFGTFRMTSPEVNRLWDLVDDARLHRRRAVPRAGRSEATTYMFSLLRPRKPVHTIEVRLEAARSDRTLAPLVRYIGRLIRKYAKKRPYLGAAPCVTVPSCWSSSDALPEFPSISPPGTGPRPSPSMAGPAT